MMSSDGTPLLNGVVRNGCGDVRIPVYASTRKAVALRLGAADIRVEGGKDTLRKNDIQA
jgi:hypothetical protein